MLDAAAAHSHSIIMPVWEQYLYFQGMSQDCCLAPGLFPISRPVGAIEVPQTQMLPAGRSWGAEGQIVSWSLDLACHGVAFARAGRQERWDRGRRQLAPAVWLQRRCIERVTCGVASGGCSRFLLQRRRCCWSVLRMPIGWSALLVCVRNGWCMHSGRLIIPSLVCLGASASCRRMTLYHVSCGQRPSHAVAYTCSHIWAQRWSAGHLSCVRVAGRPCLWFILASPAPIALFGVGRACC